MDIFFWQKVFWVCFGLAMVCVVYYEVTPPKRIDMGGPVSGFKDNFKSALSKKKEVEAIRRKLARETAALAQLKSKAKEDIEWVLSNSDKEA